MLCLVKIEIGLAAGWILDCCLLEPFSYRFFFFFLTLLSLLCDSLCVFYAAVLWLLSTGFCLVGPPGKKPKSDDWRLSPQQETDALATAGKINFADFKAIYLVLCELL